MTVRATVKVKETVLFIHATHNRSVHPFTASIGVFLRAAVRLRMNREPIPQSAVPGFEPGTATMASERDSFCNCDSDRNTVCGGGGGGDPRES